QTLGENLDWWAQSPRRKLFRQRLANEADVNPDDVIMSAEQARANGLSSTMIFPVGNIAPQGSVVKATAIDPGVVGPDNVYRKRGTVRVFTSEKDAVAAVKGLTDAPVGPGDVIVLIGIGPLGTGMEETYQLTSALKYLARGKHVPVITDGRFSGVSTGACIGHVGPEALVGGPVGRLRDGDEVEIVIDRNTLEGHISLVAADGRELTPPQAERLLSQRTPHPDLHAHEKLPDDSRLWAA